MISPIRVIAILGLAVGLSACTTGGGAATAPVASAAPIAIATLTATAVVASTVPASTVPASADSSASLDGGGGASAPPTSIDPCTLITQAEASKLIGKPLGAGVSTRVAHDRVCTFKSGLSEVKLFLAPTAPDAATAQAYYDAARADVVPGVKVDDIGGFDRAGYGSGDAAGVPVSALFVVHGTNGFDLYCGFPSCGEIASVAEATLVVSRLP